MIDLNNTYWYRVRGFLSELKIDARWILLENGTDKPVGQLRIGSFPDVRPGYLRAHFTYVTTIEEKTESEKLQSAEDYDVSVDELEIYSIDDRIETSQQTFELPLRELEEMFGIKVFGK